MILEESVLFHNDIHADEFIRFLKKKNCRASKKKESYLFEETLMKGSIGNFIAMIEELIAEDPEAFEDCPSGKENLLGTILSGYTRGQGYPRGVMIPVMLSNLRRTRDFIADIMVQFNEGDIIFSHKDLEELRKEIGTFNHALTNNSDSELISRLSDTMSTMGYYMVMEENRLIEKQLSGFILTKKGDPDKVVVERNVFGTELLGSGLLDEYDISLIREIDLRTGTRVSMDPSLYFTCAGDEIDAVISNLDVDKESAETLMFNIFHKSFTIDRLMEIIQAANRISLDEIIQQMETFTPESDDEECELVVHATPEFITGIINDVRKIGFIQGKDDKIRIFSK